MFFGLGARCGPFQRGGHSAEMVRIRAVLQPKEVFMNSSVPFENVWQTLLPLVTQERLDAVLVRGGLDSLDVREGECERLVRGGSLSVIVQATSSSKATLLVFVGAIPFVRAEVEADSYGWYVQRIAVRSSIYRLIGPTCKRMKLDLVADPALHSLGHRWVQ